MDTLTIYAAKYLIVVPVLMALYVVWKQDKKERKDFIIQLAALGVLTVLLGYASSHIITNPRPSFKDGAIPLIKPSDYNGFPSDHTLVSAFLAFGVMFKNRRLGWLMLVLAAVVGWARVAAHVHHAVDIAGAIAIAIIAYLVVGYLTGHKEAAAKKARPGGDA